MQHHILSKSQSPISIFGHQLLCDHLLQHHRPAQLELDYLWCPGGFSYLLHGVVGSINTPFRHLSPIISYVLEVNPFSSRVQPSLRPFNQDSPKDPLSRTYWFFRYALVPSTFGGIWSLRVRRDWLVAAIFEPIEALLGIIHGSLREPRAFTEGQARQGSREEPIHEGGDSFPKSPGIASFSGPHICK